MAIQKPFIITLNWTKGHFFIPFAYLSLGFYIAGCAKVPVADDGHVSSLVASRINSQVEWYQGCCQEDQIQSIIQYLMGDELTANTAIQIALLNNPKIQAIFEEIGIARADLVEAGLLTNPSYEIEIRYPHIKGLHTNIEYLITSSLLDLFLIPLRTKLALTEFEQTKLKVSHEILNLAFDVRQTYYEWITENKKLQITQSIVELTSIHSEVVSKQFQAGNVYELNFQLAQSKFLDANLELQRSQAELIRLKEKLNRLLGFTEDICLIIPENISQELDLQGYDSCILESIALEKRLDVQIARFEITRLCQMLGLKNWWTYSNLKGGLAGEREPDGANFIGPGFAGEIPIFNYGQGARLSLFSQLRQAQDILAALEIQILSEVREAHKLLMNHLCIINDYHTLILPLQSEILESSEKLYNVMGLGIDKLLENKLEQLKANQNYMESFKKYLMAKVALDRVLDGYLYNYIEN